MSRFAFEAIDRHGATVRGTLEAPNQSSVLDQLVLNGHTPVSIKVSRSQPALLQSIRRALGFSGFDYVPFLKELGILLRAGLPAERALTILRSLSQDTRASLCVQQIVERVRSGEALSQAFAATVTEAPPHIARLLAAGEASGQLAEITERVAAGLTKTRILKARLVSDLSYPAILLVAICIVLWVVFHTVLPRLAPMFKQSGAQMPLPTQVLMAMGDFFNAYGWLVLLVVVGLAGVIFYALRQQNTRLSFDRFLLTGRMTFGVPRAFEAALFCRNLQTVLDGGLPLERALGTARDGIANRWLKGEITNVQVSVREGVKLSQALSGTARSLPPLISEFAAVGEETGRLGAMMREAADILEHMAQTKLDRMTTLLVPVTTIVMGALVAGLMTGIVSGILAINDLAR